MRKSVPLPPDPSKMMSWSSQQMSNSKRQRSDSYVDKENDIESRNELDSVIAKMFYTSGIPFNFAMNPYYQQSFTFAANHDLRNYVPPSENQIRTTLLDQEKKRVDLALAPIKRTWRNEGITIVSDGWSDPSRKRLVNFMVCTESGPMFIKSVACSGELKSKDFIANLFKQVIDEVGNQNVIQVITDNPSICKDAQEIIEGIYPHIYWTPCVVRTLDLALKDIFAAKNENNNEEVYSKCHWITEVHNDVVQIKNFIVNHGMRSSIYLRFTPLKMLSAGNACFASLVVMLKRFKLVKPSLEAMVVCDQWSSYRDDDQAKARFVKEKILEEDWWSRIDYILGFTTPIYDMIQNCDNDKPCLHLVYEMWNVMVEKVRKFIYDQKHIQDIDSFTLFEVVHKILVARWTKSNTPLYCLAHSLNTRFYSSEWLAKNPTRNPPHRDDEISSERKKCLKRLYPYQDDYDNILSEFERFSLGLGSFDDPDDMAMRYTLKPIHWWANFGAPAPMLQKLAFRLLGQPTSSSCAQQNRITYAFINSLKWNKQNPKHVEDLVLVHNNLRLLYRNKSKHHDERTKIWDFDGDKFGTSDDTCLEFSDLSVDEPEMENVLFDDAEDLE